MTVCLCTLPIVDVALCESSDSDSEAHSTDQLAQMKIDEWLNFRLDQEVWRGKLLIFFLFYLLLLIPLLFAKM